jgi:hypothetical protein
MSYTDAFRAKLGEIKQPEADLNIDEFVIPGDGIAAVPEEQPATVHRTASLFQSKEIKDEELKGIADKYGISQQKLRDMADVYGGNRQVGLDEVQSTEALKDPNFWKSMALSGAGVGDTLLINAPSWIYKKMQTKQGELAFDEVRQLVEDREAPALSAGKMLLPGVGGKVAGMTKGLKAGIAAAAGIGAIAGLTGSKSGEELESAATGAATSATFAGMLSPETISSFTGLPVFKKIKSTFNRPEVAVDTLEGFKQIKNKLVGQIQKFDDISKSWGFVKQEGATLSEEHKKAISDYAGLMGQLKREAVELAPKFPTDKLGSVERKEAINTEVSKILSDLQHPLTKKIEELQAKVADVGGFIPADKLNDVTDTLTKLREKMTKIASLKAGAAKAKITEGIELSELGDVMLDSTLNAKTFVGKGGVGGFSAGTKYTTSLEEGMPTQMHEFSHRIISEVADSLSKKSGGDPTILEGAIYNKMASFIDLQTNSRLTGYLADKGYGEKEIGKELIPWMQNMLNDSRARNEYRDWLRKQTTNKAMEVDEKLGVDNFMQDWQELKKASKKITKWAGSITEDGLLGELSGATKKLGKEAGDVIDIAAMKSSGIRNIRPNQKELDNLALGGQFVDIPGLKFVDNGLGVDVFVEGKKIGGFNDLRHAQSRALEWKNKNPDKLEKLIVPAENTGRGTYIPPEE